MASTIFAPGAVRRGDGRFSLGRVEDAVSELARGNPKLIWGWKRDVEGGSRTVYFGGDLVAEGDEVVLSRWYLFYRHRAEAGAIDTIHRALAESEDLRPYLHSLRTAQLPGGQSDLRVEFGMPDAVDRDRVRRLQLRRPRRRLPSPTLPAPLGLERAPAFGPADIYVGSGLSYEAGLPTLCDMHAAFGVDNAQCTQFAVGDEDTLPPRLAGDLAGAIASFCAVHVGALRASPTRAMRAIAELKQAGLIRKVFTDNVDNVLAKASVPFERTRGSGVFNEPYPATFESHRLIVVGVAADRRSLVRRARSAGMEIVTVNPCEKVAPMVRHLDYIRETDPFYRVTADAFFTQWRSAALGAVDVARVVHPQAALV